MSFPKASSTNQVLGATATLAPLRAAQSDRFSDVANDRGLDELRELARINGLACPPQVVDTPPPLLEERPPSQVLPVVSVRRESGDLDGEEPLRLANR
jgi:hypothetical protein